jgi:plastocyanin
VRALLVALAALAVAAPVADARTTDVGVGLREFRLSPYRDVVKPGTVRFYVSNLGEDPHDFVVMRRGKTYGTTGELGAGERKTLRVRLTRRGHYRLVCTIADHESLGMKARLIVR